MKRKNMGIFAVVLLTLVMLPLAILNLPQFGKPAKGERLRRKEASLQYSQGSFKNISETPSFTSDDNVFTTFWKMFFGRRERLRPEHQLPSTKTELSTLPAEQNYLIWMGHSSYFMQLDGKKILVDPVLSGYASPFSMLIKAFEGSSEYTSDDIPEIDYLIITHDHWDHLDMHTIRDIHTRVKQIYTGLGVGAHLEHWGVDAAKINEFAWNDSLFLNDGFQLHATPARHFSGRGLKRNQTLWVSFVLQTPSLKIFIGGDGGYDRHFTDIGEKFGPFDLVLLEAGQYDKRWKYIHMHPEEVVQAASDLKARRLIPIHNSKFALAAHAWDEPLIKISEQYNQVRPDYELLTPMIGEQLEILNARTSPWWNP